MTLDEAVEFSGGDPDRIRADSLEFEVERLRRLLKPRPMSEAPRDGAAILVRSRFGWQVTRFDCDGWGCTACGGQYGTAELEAIEWLPLPAAGDEA